MTVDTIDLIRSQQTVLGVVYTVRLGGGYLFLSSCSYMTVITTFNSGEVTDSTAKVPLYPPESANLITNKGSHLGAGISYQAYTHFTECNRYV